MSTDQTLGFIKPFPYSFAPTGWLPCDGRVLPVSQNSALYAVLGNTFGGVAPTTFALPDLGGNCGIGVGQGTNSAFNYALGDLGGVYDVELLAAQNAAHSHLMFGAPTLLGAASSGAPGPTVALARSTPIDAYAANGTTGTMDPSTVASSGTSPLGLPHPNIMPYQVLNFCICVSPAG